jgi:hypothetical protein
MAKRIPSLSPPVPRTGQTVSQFNNGCHWNWTTASDAIDLISVDHVLVKGGSVRRAEPGELS